MWYRWIMMLCLGLCFHTALADTYDDANVARKRRDFGVAMRLFEQTIQESDDGRAYNSIGTMYENGEGVKRDYQKALHYYNEAGRRGNVKAYGNTAALYDRGLGVKKNVPFALELYFKGMNKGDAKSINNLGVMAGTGELLPHNLAVAWALFAFARDLGDSEAIGNLKRLQPLLSSTQLGQGQQLYQALQKAAPTARVDTFLDFMGVGK